VGFNLEILMTILSVEDAGFLVCSFNNYLTLSLMKLGISYGTLPFIQSVQEYWVKTCGEF
jgi:hypothetical protein